MKKLTLLLLLSLAFLGSANAESNIPLPSEQAVREYIYLSLFSNSKLLSNQEIIKLEVQLDEAKAKEEILMEQYQMTTDEEEKFAVGKLAFEQREEMKNIEVLLLLDKQAKNAYVRVSPRGYDELFKNHRIFSAEIRADHHKTGSLEWMFLPGSSTGGLFYTDGKSINYLHGYSRVSSLERLFKNEKLQFDTVDPQTLASFVSIVLLRHGNSGASVIDHMSDIFRRGYVINRNKNSINEDCPFNLSDYKNVEHKLLSYEEQEFLRVNLIASSFGEVINYHECFGFTDQELTTLSHDELIEIAKKRGFDFLLDIVLPSLKREGDNWILEFSALSGWMHKKNILSLNRITFSPDYKISTTEKTLNNRFYTRYPNINY